MNIIVGEERAQTLRERYTVLELDTFRVADSEPIRSYAVLEMVPITEMFYVDNMIELHHKMIEQYRLRNWSFCLDALSHLMGKWNGEIDSFYQDLKLRILSLEKQELGDNWDGIINRSISVDNGDSTQSTTT